MIDRLLQAQWVTKFSLLTGVLAGFFYAFGFLARSGETYMQGITIPVHGFQDYLLTGVWFVYQLAQALTVSLLYPLPALKWLLQSGWLWYALIAALILLGVKWLPRIRPRLSTTGLWWARGVLILALAGFGHGWTHQLFQVFQHQGLLFPFAPTTAHQRHATYQEEWTHLQQDPDPIQRAEHHQALREILLQRECRENPELRAKLLAWKAWQATSAVDKSAWLSGLVITSVLYWLALGFMLRRLDTTQGQWWFGGIFGFLVVVQSGLIGLNYGVKHLNQDTYAVVRVQSSSLPDLEGRDWLRLAEANGWMYLYAHTGDWRMRMVKSREIQDLDYLGQGDAFGWLHLISSAEFESSSIK